MKIGSLKNPQFAAKNRQSVRPSGSLFAPRGVPVGNSPDLERIVALPRRAQVQEDSVTGKAIILRETAKYSRDRTGMGPCRCKEINPDQGCITELLFAQAILLREIGMARGAIGAVPVGGGKTLVDILSILALGLKREKKQQGLLLVPANLIGQICDDYQLIAEHFIVPEIIVHKTGGDWAASAPGQPVLHVMTHDAVSSPRDSEYIEGLRPSAIIVDEVDCLSNLLSARTLRVLRYFNEYGEETMFCGWTGSLTDKSITEMAHLFAWAFKDRSPLPLDQDVVEEIARCIDAVDRPCAPGALMRLVEDQDLGQNDIQRARTAFGRRMAETLGVVVTDTAEVRVTGGDGLLTDELVRLEIVPRVVPAIPIKVEEALRMVRDNERPDTMAGGEFNDPIEDALSQAKYARQVACGMFYYAYFPRGESRELIAEWYMAKSAWFAERREVIARGERLLDSPKLCENAAKRAWGDMPLRGVEKEMRTYVHYDDDGEEVHEESEVEVDYGRLPVWKASTWPAWRDIEDKVKPEQRAHRLDKFLVQDAADWALENKGIVWVSMVELGLWIAELSGLPLMGGGPKAGELLMREIRGNDRSIIASVKSHGRGRNGMQHRFSQQYLINVISSNKVMEQVLGRAHRRGQKASVVRTEVCLHTPELQKSFDQALRRSDYVQDLLKQTQKLRMAIPA